MSSAADPYITNADIEERLGSQAYVQLTDDDGDGIANVGVVNEARHGAMGEVNSYLAQRYDVPIKLSTHTELAGLLKSVCLDLVEYSLRSRRPPVPDITAKRREQAVHWLKGVANGSIHLPSDTPIASNTTRGTIASAVGSERLLSRDALDEF